MDRRLAAILAADMVGYSRAMQADEVGTLAALTAFRKDAIEPLVAAHRGRIVKLMGDGVLAEFASVVDAVACAAAWQERATGGPLQFRIGVNLGDIVAEDGDIFGTGVNVAARLQTLAQPGEICISGMVHGEVKNKLELAFEDLGDQTVKNIEGPVRAWRVVPNAGDAPRAATDASTPAARPAHAASDRPSVAVLPFVNMSGDPEQEYFSDGITEDIITELARFSSLFVIARNSSFLFKNQAVDIVDVGRKLGVRYIVEGSVRKSGNRVRISAQLVDARSAKHIWAERYDRNLDDIFTIQDEVVATIAESLGHSLRDAEFGAARIRPAGNLQAYDLLLRGRAAWWNRQFADAFRNVERALDVNPDYAAAHAWLATQYTYDQFKWELNLPIEQKSQKAMEHAQSALNLDQNDIFVHMAVGMAFTFTPHGDRIRGLRHSDVTVARNPHDFEIIYCRAYVLGMNGRCAEALEWLGRLGRLSPVTSWHLSEAYFDVYSWMNEHAKALDAISTQGELSINNYLHIAAANVRLGRIPEARSWTKRFEQRKPPHFDTSAYLQFLQSIKFGHDSYDTMAELLQEAGLKI
jgi:adenylate cyclase